MAAKPNEMSQMELEEYIDDLIERGENDRGTKAWEAAHAEWERRLGSNVGGMIGHAVAVQLKTFRRAIIQELADQAEAEFENDENLTTRTTAGIASNWLIAKLKEADRG
ncbi:hypothetical protein [Arthrobacter sp. RCC_34]|uniref:hypothetical protein n=1 Tax=Arthrobacter sp. RCC_34 TaxID=3239230 RepID=UPI00352324E6